MAIGITKVHKGIIANSHIIMVKIGKKYLKRPTYEGCLTLCYFVVGYLRIIYESNLETIIQKF
jgi:hypothetical protein